MCTPWGMYRGTSGPQKHGDAQCASEVNRTDPMMLEMYFRNNAIASPRTAVEM